MNCLRYSCIQIVELWSHAIHVARGFRNEVHYKHNTVNSEIFARTLFSRNFAYAKFRENKTLAKWQNHSVVY